MTNLIFLEDGGNTFLRNVNDHLQVYTASQPKITINYRRENLKSQIIEIVSQTLVLDFKKTRYITVSRDCLHDR